MDPYRKYRFIGVDPGYDTGIATYDVVGDPRIHSSWQEFQVLPADVTSTLETLIIWAENHAFNVFIGTERFIIGTSTAKKTPQPDALMVIGKVEDLPRKFPEVNIRLQNAAEAKKFTDKHLKRLGGYAKNRRHSNDAKRHILRLMVDIIPEYIVEVFEDYTI